jgi:hypothetical protein
MTSFLEKLFVSDFMPHGHCYFWQPDVLWPQVGSDAVIALSYYSIPLALVCLVRSRRDLAFNWMFLMFAGFIFACGTSHIMEIWTVWHGTYRLQAVIKLITAVFSLTTAILLWPLIQKAKLFPSSNRLQEEIQSRELAQEQLRQSNEQLETRVAERTMELQRSNDQLKDKTDKLQRYYNVTVDRELQMLALKEEINELLAEMNRPAKYRVLRSSDIQSNRPM